MKDRKIRDMGDLSPQSQVISSLVSEQLIPDEVVEELIDRAHRNKAQLRSFAFWWNTSVNSTIKKEVRNFALTAFGGLSMLSFSEFDFEAERRKVDQKGMSGKKKRR